MDSNSVGSFSLDLSELIKGLDDLERMFAKGLKIYAETAAKKLEGTAKKDRVWIDRTGVARQRLTGSTTTVDAGELLELSHGVYYGIFLELCNAGNYAIIMPTIYKESREIMEGLQNLFERCKA